MATALNIKNHLISDTTHRVKWGKAALAGLITGLILLFANRGLPWTSSGIILPNVMGRNVLPGNADGNTMWLGIAFAHLAVSAIYGLIIGAIVFKLRPIPAAFAGGVIGLILYFVNLALFSVIVPDARQQSELSPVIMHLAFGIICAGCYKGVAKREVAPELKHSGPQES
ncbi:MAG: hypothetical protein ACO1QB_10210 [Verrucomicrobiales bacterium]